METVAPLGVWESERQPSLAVRRDGKRELWSIQPTREHSTLIGTFPRTLAWGVLVSFNTDAQCNIGKRSVLLNDRTVVSRIDVQTQPNGLARKR